MSDAIVGEIRMFGGNFAPVKWSFCNGQLMAIAQNSALFSLLGTTYGGDGRSSFGLPDMRGRIPVQHGHGPGLSNWTLGHREGTETVTLTVSQMPNHNHSLMASTNDATTDNVSAAVTAKPTYNFYREPTDATRIQEFADEILEQTGAGTAHTNLMPFQCISFIICTIGLYPSRN